MCELNPPRDRNRCLDLLINTINLKELMNIIIKTGSSLLFLLRLLRPAALARIRLGRSTVRGLAAGLTSSRIAFVGGVLAGFCGCIVFFFLPGRRPFSFCGPFGGCCVRCIASFPCGDGVLLEVISYYGRSTTYT